MFQLASAARLALATAILTLYCVVQAGPHLYTDTQSYYLLGREVAALVHLAPAVEPTQAAPALGGAPVIDERLRYTTAAARSPYYGALLYLTHRIGGFWLVVVLQSFFSALVLFVASRVLSGGRGFLSAVLGLAVFSSLPVFTQFVMPDFLVPLAILSAGLLLLRWAELTRTERAFLWGMVAIGCLSHNSIAVLALALALLGAVGWLLLRRSPGVQVSAAAAGLLALAAVIGAGGAAVYGMAVQAKKHQAIYAPPFLTARVFADGSGRRFLQHACARDEHAFVMCRFRNAPIRNSDDFLWTRSQVFQSADYDTRVGFIAEQRRLVLGTIGFAPLEVLGDSLGHLVALLGEVGTDEALDSRIVLIGDPKFAELQDLQSPGAPCRAAATCHNRIPSATMTLLVELGLAAGLATMLVLLGGGLVDRRRWLPITGFVLLAILGNAAICGPLSGHAQRYQSRVTWLIPALALLMLADGLGARGTRRRRFRLG